VLDRLTMRGDGALFLLISPHRSYEFVSIAKPDELNRGGWTSCWSARSGCSVSPS
jgi:hypothetical protein